MSQMTPQEELFKEYYNDERAVQVVNMTDEQLSAHRDELRRIAFEARVRYTAAEDELNERKVKRPNSKIVSLQSDEVATNAINTVKQRAARMNKMEKVRENLAAMGLSEEEINQMVSASARAALKDDKAKLNASSNGNTQVAQVAIPNVTANVTPAAAQGSFASMLTSNKITNEVSPEPKVEEKPVKKIASWP